MEHYLHGTEVGFTAVINAFMFATMKGISLDLLHLGGIQVTGCSELCIHFQLCLKKAVIFDIDESRGIPTLEKVN